MTLTPTDIDPDLYGQDLDLGDQETALKVQEGDFRRVDVENLIEEILSLSNRNQREVLSWIFSYPIV
ncbi:DUF29 family protein [Thermosynechococcaceae cyanobacterium BACA0444]|uniref:DUF29 family protein n=1 Tax=Pseudocalidococcus azoricus BACA0444 TaxID=2918990 RepID=A0AAE4FTR6_9CYAN|nr:DUF29 family protein [Pseudocalidococcus azoricus]MDS3862036.1 DUF29 family protein [Pseudocalidococcus azoricus BACA0444]